MSKWCDLPKMGAPVAHANTYLPITAVSFLRRRKEISKMKENRNISTIKIVTRRAAESERVVHRCRWLDAESTFRVVILPFPSYQSRMAFKIVISGRKNGVSTTALLIKSTFSTLILVLLIFRARVPTTCFFSLFDYNLPCLDLSREGI